MKIRKAKAEENRSVLIAAASRLTKEFGINGVGVEGISKGAGLTHGALYAHFSSKDALIAAALSQNFKMGAECLNDSTSHISLDHYLDSYLSIVHRDNPADGCPMAASASEIGRQDEEIGLSFTEGFLDIAEAINKKLGSSKSSLSRQTRSFAIISALVGGVAMARATAKTDPEVSLQILNSIRMLIRDFEGTSKIKTKTKRNSLS